MITRMACHVGPLPESIGMSWVVASTVRSMPKGPLACKQQSDTRALPLCMRRVQISRTGVTVAAVVHQPSWEIFSTFADLLLLCEGGRSAYYGPVRDVQARMLACRDAADLMSGDVAVLPQGCKQRVHHKPGGC